MSRAGFAALFNAECHRCGRDIIPGQRVVYVGHARRLQRLVHVGCASGADDE